MNLHQRTLALDHEDARIDNREPQFIAGLREGGFTGIPQDEVDTYLARHQIVEAKCNVEDFKAMTEFQIEAVARRLCIAHGLDADEMVACGDGRTDTIYESAMRGSTYHGASFDEPRWMTFRRAASEALAFASVFGVALTYENGGGE